MASVVGRVAWPVREGNIQIAERQGYTFVILRGTRFSLPRNLRGRFGCCKRPLVTRGAAAAFHISPIALPSIRLSLRYCYVLRHQELYVILSWNTIVQLARYVMRIFPMLCSGKIAPLPFASSNSSLSARMNVIYTSENVFI